MRFDQYLFALDFKQMKITETKQLVAMFKLE